MVYSAGLAGSSELDLLSFVDWLVEGEATVRAFLPFRFADSCWSNFRFSIDTAGGLGRANT